MCVCTYVHIRMCAFVSILRDLCRRRFHDLAQNTIFHGINFTVPAYLAISDTSLDFI